MEIKGISTIMITPFQENGDLDLGSLSSMVRFQMRAGVHGLTILGIMGEAHKLTELERSQVIETVVKEVDGRIPVTVGCTANGTDVAVYYSKMAEALGANAVMVAPPANLKNYELIFQHYAAIGRSVSLPIVIQDEPVTTNVLLPAAFQARLEREIENIKYCKLEEAPSPMKITNLLKETYGQLTVFGGLGGVYFYEELLRGACGIMTGFAFPEVLVAVYNAFTAGDKTKARDIFYKYLPLIRFEAQLGIGGVTIRKEIFKERGIIKSSHVRSPGVPVDLTTLGEMKDLLECLDLSEDTVQIKA
ncbi:dihydrodipicolinate synthase family protein [Paenibacillus piri]|uniref:Dihydrodipicolinate synthase family protein n=1 Tax=Paenibacillus piri TaxID=2547395 RepID=A0A4R5K740_9BACL|nr:dihydrodipicolinate synthase family protein [Paenibacillus piri]TDF89730.1 dihydrodipicolinate synthase family protein [Paenibacillus piri]